MTEENDHMKSIIGYGEVFDLVGAVKDFHEKFGHPVRTVPTIPTEDEVRFRLKLISEEFFELLRAIYGAHHSYVMRAEEVISWLLDNASVGPHNTGPGRREVGGIKEEDLPEIADALGDLEYVIVGTAHVFGFPWAAILSEIQRANMCKEVAYVNSKDGYHNTGGIKPKKPEGWRPPDIAGLLITAGKQYLKEGPARIAATLRKMGDPRGFMEKLWDAGAPAREALARGETVVFVVDGREVGRVEP